MSEKQSISVKKTGRGGYRANAGRKKGEPNKMTTEFRETIKNLLESNADNVGRWLSMVAEGHGETKPAPDKALDLMAKLAEYAAPKLARTEHVGDGGGPVRIVAAPLDEKL